jgi:hypothetical protein
MTLGLIAFLGSGETSLAGGRIYDSLAQSLPRPIRIAVLETPAGFELNSLQVAGRVADFLSNRLQNYHPQVDVVPARRKNSLFSPDDPEICAPLLTANIIFMGPGSPTYAVRHLKNSLAWDIIRARHRLGATLVFASAATIAVGAWALPVYEIYKVGADVHALPGLDFFRDFGTPLSFLPHWNNADGGADVDTSRCFVGMERFAEWCALLPADNTTIGLDEHTGIILDFAKRTCCINGVSSIHLVRKCNPNVFPAGSDLPMIELGAMLPPDPIETGIPADIWKLVKHAVPVNVPDELPPPEVVALADDRQHARNRKDWLAADDFRRKITALGWTVQDTPDGYNLAKA